MFQHLLLAIDRRDGSFRMAVLGLRLAWCLGARVTVVYVVPTQRTGDEAPPAGVRAHDAVMVGDRLFRRVRRLASRAGVPCICRYAFGRDPGSIVSEAAAAHACDLIVLNGP